MIFHRSARLKLRPYGTVQICLLFLILLLLSHTIDSRNQRRSWWYALSFITHTHTFNGPLSRTTWVSRYQIGKTSLDFTEARDSQWEWHQLGHMQVCTSLQTDNHASTPPLSFLQARCPSCRLTNSECVCVCIVEWPPASSIEGNALPFINQCQTTAEHSKHPDRKTLIKIINHLIVMFRQLRIN